jgi:hypothetical protein
MVSFKARTLIAAFAFVAACTARADVSFRNDVQPILTRAGCNSGACHGAAAGKNGFKLSLRGYDDEGDWKAITRSAFGRRIVPEDPANSLFLLKPTAAVPHKGGVRFQVGSPEYQVLVNWIAQGAPGPKADDPRIESIEVLPKHAVLKVGAEQQVKVIAHFNNGVTQDVTHRAKYTANDTSVATVDDDSKVKIIGRGEAPITAWYLSRIATATMTVPFDAPASMAIFDQAPRRNFIDELAIAKLRDLNLPPSPRCSDPEFIRRAFIDAIGVLPTAQEARAFLADPSPGKRDALIESLLARPEFVDYWAYKWSDLLLVNSQKLRPPAMWAYYNWIRRQVAANTSWDELAREVVTATGSTLENGAANYYVLHDDPMKMSETTAVAFLGMSINCAKCHNHPLEKWTNDQYFAMANIFARVRAKNAPSGDGNFIVFSAAAGDLVQPLTGKPRPPTPLDGQPMSMESSEDRRLKLADWLVSPQNPYFTRAIVNRVWANFMGVGLVEAVDDMRKTNPPSNEALLAALADELVKQRYDLKSLMRLILQSETYQRSGEALAANVADRRFYSHYYPRRMMAEVMLDAVSQVTGAPTAFKDYPPGTRAIQLPDSNVESYFLQSFGRPERINTCECERTSLPSMAQALHIANGETVNTKLAAKGNRIEQLLAEKAADEKIVEEVYLGALARFPAAAEAKALTTSLASAGAEKRREAVEDLYWGVLSSNAFLFNH